MDKKLAKAIEFIKLLRWQYPLPSTLDEIDKFVFECEKEAAEQSVHPTAFGVRLRARLANWLFDTSTYLSQSGGG